MQEDTAQESVCEIRPSLERKFLTNKHRLEVYKKTAKRLISIMKISEEVIVDMIKTKEWDRLKRLMRSSQEHAQKVLKIQHPFFSCNPATFSLIHVVSAHDQLRVYKTERVQ